MSDTPSPFPPADIRGFLLCCAGDWLSLRSRLALEGPEDQEGEEWHRSERCELRVEYLEPLQPGAPGSLAITPPEGPRRRLEFHAGGVFHSEEREGRWELWPDGSLELVVLESGGEVRERIWFAKPNLRLRSSVEHRADGTPARAGFSSEIRRISPPGPPAA